MALQRDATTQEAGLFLIHVMLKILHHDIHRISLIVAVGSVGMCPEGRCKPKHWVFMVVISRGYWKFVAMAYNMFCGDSWSYLSPNLLVGEMTPTSWGNALDRANCANIPAGSSTPIDHPSQAVPRRGSLGEHGALCYPHLFAQVP